MSATIFIKCTTVSKVSLFAEMQSPFISQLCWQWHLESSRINTTLLISHLTARWVTLFVGRFRIVTIMASSSPIQLCTTFTLVL